MYILSHRGNFLIELKNLSAKTFENFFGFFSQNLILIVLTIKMTSQTAERVFRAQHIFKQLYPWNSKFELATHLCKNIIYSSGGIIAVNKPYGVGVKTPVGSKKKTDLTASFGMGCKYTLEDTLPIMREELRLPKLAVVKSAERFNSGVTIYAENEKDADKIKKNLLLVKHLDLKNSVYNIVTLYLPYKGLSGAIYSERVGITLGENPLQGVSQPLITRDFSKGSVERQDVQIVRAEFTVKDVSQEKTALVELSVNETKWNFLRVYCADMLMPILGDHLYGSRVALVQGLPTRLNPLHARPGSIQQTLSARLLECLQLEGEQNGSSLVPLHVHLRHFIIPNFIKPKEHLTITAPFPQSFTWTCNRLQLSVPPDW